MFLFHIVINTVLLSLTFAKSPFSSYDCIFGSKFDASKCSWKLTDKFPLTNEEGKRISGTFFN